MLTLSYREINDPTMNNALSKLDSCTSNDFPAKVMFDLTKVIAVWDKHCHRARRDFQKLIDKHAEKEQAMKAVGDGKEEPINNKDGTPLMVPKKRIVGGQVGFVYKDEEAFNKDSEELLDQEFTIKCHPFKIEDFAKAGLTLKELRSCAKILADVPEEWKEEQDQDGNDGN